MLEMSSRRRLAVTLGVITGMFLAALEATVVGTAMPTVISSLGGLNHYSWVFSAYLITSTVTVPVWGKLSDLYGRRLFFQLGIAIFLARLGALGDGGHDDAAHHLPRGAGVGCRRAHPARDDDHRRRLHGRGARADAGVLQRRVGDFERGRPHRRRVHHRPALVALGLLHQRAVRHPRRDHHAARAQGAEADVAPLHRLRGRGAADGVDHAPDAGARRGRGHAQGVRLGAQHRARGRRRGAGRSLPLRRAARRRPHRAARAVPQPRRVGLGRGGVPGGRGDVRRHLVRAALRAGRFGLDGDRGRVAPDAAHAELGRALDSRREAAAEGRLQADDAGGARPVNARLRAAVELPARRRRACGSTSTWFSSARVWG